MTSKMQQPAIVVIAGAGPVGKVLALELSRAGVDSVLVDPGTGAPDQPRARIVSARSMELMRRHGLADKVRGAALLPADYPMNVVYTTRLNGYVLCRFDAAYGSARSGSVYPEPGQHIPQDRFERVLLQAVRADPRIDLRLGWRVDTFQQDERGVHVELENEVTGERQDVRAAFLAGCDGAHSDVRRALGVQLVGEREIMYSHAVEFRSWKLPEVIERARLGFGTQYWAINHEAPVLVSALDGATRWSMMWIGDNIPDQIDPVLAIQQAVGAPIDVELLGVTVWRAHALVAERYRDGRVILLGDAIHQHPPTGGYGMNTGIEDSVNLGWKLAATIQGWGGPALLDTYEPERRPVHEHVIREAAETGVDVPSTFIREFDIEVLEQDSPEGMAERENLTARIRDTKARQHINPHITAGSDYSASSITVADARTPGDEDDFIRKAFTGRRAPSVGIDSDETIFDRFGTCFTLLTRGSATEFMDATAVAGIPLVVVELGSHAMDAYPSTHTLIRPDGYIAWQGEPTADSRSVLDTVSGMK